MFCLHCGKEIPDQSAFCMACGKPIATAKRSRSWPWPTIAAVAGAFLMGVLLMTLKYVADRRSQSVPIATQAPSQPVTAPASTSTRPSALSPPPPTKLSPGEIATKYTNAVVVLENYNKQGQKASQGSGFIFSPEGRVLTNYHVIRGASRMVARMHDQSTHDVEWISGYDIQRCCSPEDQHRRRHWFALGSSGELLNCENRRPCDGVGRSHGPGEHAFGWHHQRRSGVRNVSHSPDQRTDFARLKWRASIR